MALPPAKPRRPMIRGALAASTRPVSRAEGQGPRGPVLTAPDCAESLWCPTGALDQMLDDVALYSVVRLAPDLSQRGLLDKLVPVMGRSRVLAAVSRGLDQAWLVERQGPRRARPLRTVDTPVLDGRVIGLAVGALEQLLEAGVLPGLEDRRRLTLVARRVVASKGDL